MTTTGSRQKAEQFRQAESLRSSPINHKLPAAQVGRLQAGEEHDKRGDLFELCRATDRHLLAREIELLRHRRHDEARMHGLGPQVVTPQLHRHGLLEVTHCDFESDVAVQSCAAAQQLDRRDSDDPPMSSRLHRENSVPYLEGVAVDRRYVAGSCVIHEQIHGAEGGNCGRDERLPARRPDRERPPFPRVSAVMIVTVLSSRALKLCLDETFVRVLAIPIPTGVMRSRYRRETGR